jgi:hypothetical protein
MGIPLPPAAQVLRFTIEGTTPRAPWVNALHFGYTGGPPSAANCTALASLLLATWNTEFAPLMLTSATIEKATCTDLTSSTANSGVAEDILPGSRGTAELPGSASVIVKKIVGRRYRGGHPRSYIFAGIATDMADPSHWAAGLVAAVNGAYTTVAFGTLNGMVEGTTTLGPEVVVSYFDTVTVPLAPHRRVVPLVLPITSTAALSRIGSQRRRIGA